MQVTEKELWKTIHIQQVQGFYEVSSYGNIKSLSRSKHTPHGGSYISKEKLLKLSKTNNGYLNVTLSNKPFTDCFFVHILVGTLFVTNPNPVLYKFINHEDGNKENNHYLNLKWCDRSYNMLHAFSTGLIPYRRKRKSTA